MRPNIHSTYTPLDICTAFEPPLADVGVCLRPVGYALSRSFSDLFAGSELTYHETRIFFYRLVPSICHSTIHHLFTSHLKYAPYFPRDTLGASVKELHCLSFLGHFCSPISGFSSPSLFISASAVSITTFHLHHGSSRADPIRQP
jgi:hypothetical protein